MERERDKCNCQRECVGRVIKCVTRERNVQECKSVKSICNLTLPLSSG